MTYLHREDVTVAAATASGATAYSRRLQGYVHAVAFTPGTASAWSSAADFSLTAEIGGHDILHVDLTTATGQIFFPRRNANTTASGTLDPAGNTSGRQGERVPVAAERVRIIGSSMGAGGRGTVRLYVEGGLY